MFVGVYRLEGQGFQVQFLGHDCVVSSSWWKKCCPFRGDRAGSVILSAALSRLPSCHLLQRRWGPSGDGRF